MGSTVRLLAFMLCGALGVGVAVCVATSGSLAPNAPAASTTTAALSSAVASNLTAVAEVPTTEAKSAMERPPTAP